MKTKTKKKIARPVFHFGTSPGLQIIIGTIKGFRDSAYAGMEQETSLRGRLNADEIVAFIEMLPGDDEVRMIWVEPRARRQGIATRAYAAIEKRYGVKLRPSTRQEPDGQAFWAARQAKRGRR